MLNAENNEKAKNTQNNNTTQTTQIHVEKLTNKHNDSQKEPDIQTATAELLQKLQNEITHCKDMYLRALAENENIRKRYAKELDETRDYAITSMAKDLAELKENFRIAKNNINADLLKNEQVAAIYKGIEIMDKLFEDMLKSYGIKQILPTGEIFNHNYHQAVQTIKSDEHPEGTIINVIKSGYLIKDRLLIPALVTITEKS